MKTVYAPLSGFEQVLDIIKFQAVQMSLKPICILYFLQFREGFIYMSKGTGPETKENYLKGDRNYSSGFDLC